MFTQTHAIIPLFFNCILYWHLLYILLASSLLVNIIFSISIFDGCRQKYDLIMSSEEKKHFDLSSLELLPFKVHPPPFVLLHISSIGKCRSLHPWKCILKFRYTKKNKDAGTTRNFEFLLWWTRFFLDIFSFQGGTFNELSWNRIQKWLPTSTPIIAWKGNLLLWKN